MKIHAEISLYPLGAEDMTRAISGFVDHFARVGLTAETGPMSTAVCGEADLFFDALREAWAAAADQGRAVAVVKLSNLGAR